MKNVKLNDNFTQVCVWPGTEVKETEVEAFVGFMLENFKCRIQFLETVETAPDMKNGYPVEGTGGRHDVFFAVHSEDVGDFAIPRITFGIRWIEDVYGNKQGHLYPARIKEYCSW